MIGYVTLGTNNLEKASEFYDALFATIDGTRTFKAETSMQAISGISTATN